MRAEQAEMQGTHMISGEVIRVEDANYFVKDQGGKEVSVQTDQRTEKPEINQGDRISAYVDDQNHAVWIRSNKMTDRRTEHASADCVPN
jgi:predicted RNA-binding protein (virulence factor B family)